jgi:hypothetical protein
MSALLHTIMSPATAMRFDTSLPISEKKRRHPELVEGSIPLVAVAGSATVRRRACAGYLGGHRPPLQPEINNHSRAAFAQFGMLGMTANFVPIFPAADALLHAVVGIDTDFFGGFILT